MMKTLEKSYFYQLPPFHKNLFVQNVELLPSVDEVFELELAYLEYNSLDKHELLDRTAYFKSVDNKLSKHFLMCRHVNESILEERSPSTRNYFEEGLFSTGYATHGLFPYRGKFHPQLIKALINIIGIKKGEVVLDPMCGSGTTNVEAALMGINSYAIDLSPFCRFMTKVKYNSLFVNIMDLNLILKEEDQLFSSFSTRNPLRQSDKVISSEKMMARELALLAFFDSLGYSKRVITFTHRQLFTKVLKRYVETVRSFLKNNSEYLKDIGSINILDDAGATKILLEPNSVDGIITSPPYSFAIDYVKNDEAQLNYLGYDVNIIRNHMIGLNGRNKDERLANYFRDMDTVCSEIARVLKNNKFFVMIIGSNTNQTGGIRLEDRLTESCRKYQLFLVKSILKPIKGMRNTMKDEYILFFQKRCYE